MVDGLKMRKFVTFCLHSLNYFGIAGGFVSVLVDFNTKTFYESKFINFYVTIINVLTVALLPCAHVITITYITSKIKNNLLAFTDLVTLFIKYIVVAFSVMSRCKRQRLFKELSTQLFALDATFFDKIKTNSTIQKRADWIILMKMLTFVLELYVPIHGVIKQSSRVDAYVITLAIYSSFIGCTLDAVMFMFFLMTWQMRRRIWQINAHLVEMFQHLEHLQFNSSGVLSTNSVTLKELGILATEDLRKTAVAHACLSTLLLRLNSSYRWQVLAVLLNCMIGYISYGYYWVTTMQGATNSHQQDELSLFASIAVSLIVSVDINLLYWAADATTRAYQETGQIMRDFEVLAQMDKTFEQQCETFSMQLKQQTMKVNICGMFNLNRQTSLALWSFILRHIIILVQFDVEDRKQADRSSLVLEEINRWLEFGENK